MAEKIGTREQLLKVALDLIWAHSYGAVSVDDICKKAKAQKGSFYHYFESKSELAKAALEAAWEEIRPELDRIFSTQVPALERLRNYAEFSRALQIDMGKQIGFVVGCPFTTVGSERCSCDDGLTQKSWEVLVRFRKYFVSALRDACEEGTIKLDNYDQSAQEIFTHYLGANAEARLTNSLKPMENLFEVWLRMMGAANAEAKTQQSASA